MPLLDNLVGDAEVTSLFADDARLDALIAVEAALARASGTTGLIPQEAASRIVELCRDFTPDRARLAEGLARDGVEIPDLIRQLRLAVGEPHAVHAHFGATSQDIIDTAQALAFARLFDLLDARLETLITHLDDWARREGDLPLMAHTRMQRALPFTAAAKLATWTQPLRRHRARLADLRAHALTVQLGGPVGTADSFRGHAPAIIAAMADELGLAATTAWHSERDRIADIGHILARITGSLGKMGQDIGMMAQNEVGEIVLSGGGGSSVMGHKNNPVSAEVLVALARHAAGLQGTLLQAMVHESERSGAAWTLEWMVLPPLAQSTGAALRHALRLIEGARFVAMK
ncbi:3-carboxy-cis,cis-muconate cycloisomerase [Skermanella stibiiresistens SB22]|uniref:3-carboxy-cis,cis-muconate cycloisomerase n=1 Tax=Skermanella stibiiresistens SB22 TaxID=1385369 RepID=W9HA38_9PROT|nr:3-carboxy-cis,cis-muconate cycloisomerase [Skermanella stibiiresistens]EWY40693.1 3-carboxy-cis,cis-muconate cycloisomerase [Skermanella stibiiresistens SB22]